MPKLTLPRVDRFTLPRITCDDQRLLCEMAATIFASLPEDTSQGEAVRNSVSSSIEIMKEVLKQTDPYKP